MSDEELISLRFLATGARGVLSRESQKAAASALYLELVKRNILAMPDHVSPDQPVKSIFTGTVFERMVQFFNSRNNEPAKVSEIKKAIGSQRGAVAVVLCTTHKNKFERCPPDLKKSCWPMWKLKQ